MLRIEILAARPMIAAYEEGRAERQHQFDAAVKAIDFSPLDKNDQAGLMRRCARRKTNCNR